MFLHIGIRWYSSFASVVRGNKVSFLGEVKRHCLTDMLAAFWMKTTKRPYVQSLDKQANDPKESSQWESVQKRSGSWFPLLLVWSPAPVVCCQVSLLITSLLTVFFAVVAHRGLRARTQKLMHLCTTDTKRMQSDCSSLPDATSGLNAIWQCPRGELVPLHLPVPNV